MIRRLSPVLLAALLLAALLLAAPAAQAQGLQTPGQQQIRAVSISGYGSVSAEPDMATVRIGARVEAPTPQEAAARNREIMNAAYAELAAAGIERKHVRTVNFQLKPLYRSERDGKGDAYNVVRAYEATNLISVTLLDLEKVGPAIDALIAAGANEAAGVVFDFQNRAAMVREARLAAAQDAVAKAEAYARVLGVKLGPIQSFRESGGWEDRRRAEEMARLEAGPAPTPVSGGERTVGAALDVTWTLED